MQPGDVVGDRFVIEAVGGSGGMGVVYRARDRTTDEIVALKVLHDASAYSARFDRETQLLAELDHPAIVRYVAHGFAANGQPYLVMDWLDGTDLGARLADGAFTPADALTLAARLAEGLAYAHERGVVHRDLKPGNVILVGGDIARATLVDFGIARLPGQTVTDTGGILGTLGYMSPEQARGDPDIDARADVFALGAVLYACLTGTPPFDGPNPVAVLLRLIDEKPMHPAELAPTPAAFDDLVARMLTRDREARPADGRAVAQELARVSVAEGPTVYAPAAKSPSPRRPVTRWRLPLALALTFSAGVAAVLVAIAASSSAPPHPRGGAASAAHPLPCPADLCVPLGLTPLESVDLRDLLRRTASIARAQEPTAHIVSAQFKATKNGVVDTTQPPPAGLLFYFVYTPQHGEKKTSIQMNVASGVVAIWRTPIGYDNPPPPLPEPRCSGRDAWRAAAKGVHMDAVMTATYYGLQPGAPPEWGFTTRATGSLTRVDAFDCHLVK